MKAEFFEKRAEAGMGGPNIGTFLDREMARLQIFRFSQHNF